MHLTVLAVPGCPNAPVLQTRLATVLAGREGISVSLELVRDEDEAARLGMHGSPTLLIDGTDPFAEPGQAMTMSCRLYRDGDGQASGAPSVGQLRAAIDRSLASAEAGDPAWLDVLGRAGRGRVAPVERGQRAVHQAVLRSFAQVGAAPSLSALAESAAPFELAQVLSELADGDFLGLDDAGRITAAYPFSPRPTEHRLRIAGTRAYAMCSIDALGVSAMVGLPVLIESTDPATGEPITIEVDGDKASWHPATAVAYAGRIAGTCAGPSASVCCGYTNFFATRAAVTSWASEHPQVTGGILDQDRALAVGIGIFGELLR